MTEYKKSRIILKNKHLRIVGIIFLGQDNKIRIVDQSYLFFYLAIVNFIMSCANQIKTVIRSLILSVCTTLMIIDCKVKYMVLTYKLKHTSVILTEKYSETNHLSHLKASTHFNLEYSPIGFCLSSEIEYENG